MIVTWGSCIFVKVYLCMGWRGVCGVKVRVIDKLILGCMYVLVYVPACDPACKRNRSGEINYVYG